MRKNVFKVVAACAAACFVSGLVIVNGGAGTAKADDGVICNYTFDDGNTEGLRGDSCTITVIDGKNSTFDDKTVGESGKCIKISSRNGYWETSGLAYDLNKLEKGKTYVFSLDVIHENQAVDKTYSFKDKEGSNQTVTESYTDLRVGIIHYQPNYGQIGQPTAVFTEEWERISYNFTVPDDLDTSNNCYMYFEFAYPENTKNHENDAYKCENKEDYYVDNFSIKEYVEETATPAPAATDTPAPAEPTATPGAEQPVATPLPPVEEGPDLEFGYEEAVKGINYRVESKDTVTAIGFDVPKSSLTIPATVTLEGYVYKVIAIDKEAFKGENIKSLTIGANVQTIGKSAFQNCKSLKKITIKSTVIKSIGKSAFKKTAAKATVKVPKAKIKDYQKKLKKAGLSKKAKVKK